MFSETVCKWEKGYRACKNACPHGSIAFSAKGKPGITWDICKKCETFDCVAIVCPNNALKQCVKEYTVDELVAVLRLDFNNWGSEGGGTFSGGEPMMQHEFLAEVLKICHTLQIHTAIETSGCMKLIFEIL